MSDPAVTMRLKADTTGLQAGLKQAEGGLDGLHRSAKQGRDEMGRFVAGANRAERSAAGLGAAANRTGNFIRGMIGAAAVRQAVQLADSYINIQSRLNLVAQSEERYAAARDQTYAVAQRTFSSLESTATLYGRMQTATDSLGRSQRDAIRTTELINKTFQISGTDASTASAAIIQLSQGLGAGALRGDEFNSVMEGAPRLADALATSLGKTRGELREMAEQGQITADLIIDAILKQGDAIDAEFAQLEITAGRGWQNIQNAATRALGEISQQVGATKAIGLTLQGIAAGIERLPEVTELWADSLRPGLEALADMLQYIDDFVIALVQANPVLDYFFGALASGGDESVSLFQRIAEELAILPVSLRTVATIIIGELDKLRISGIEQFELLQLGAEGVWIGIEQGASLLGSQIKLLLGQAIDFVLQRYAVTVAQIAALAEGVGATETAAELRALSAELQTAAGFEAAVRAEIEANATAYNAERAAIEERKGAISAAAATQRDAADSAIQSTLDERDAAIQRVRAERQLAEATNDTRDATLRNTQTNKLDEAARKAQEKAIRQQTKALQEQAAALASLDRIIEAGNASSEAMRSAIEENQREMLEFNKLTAVLLRDGPVLESVQRQIAKAYDLVTDAAERRIDAARQEEDFIGRLNDDYAEAIRLAGMSEEQRRIEIVIAQARVDAERTLGRAITETEEAQLRAAATFNETQLRMVQQARESADEYRRAWESAFDGVFDSLGTALVRGFSEGLDQLEGVLERFQLDSFKRISDAARSAYSQGSANGGGFSGGIRNVFSGFQNNFGNGTGFTNPGGGMNWGNVAQFAGGAYSVYDNFRNGPGGVQGALSGVASGISAGAVFGPPGMIVGAIVGALSGLLGGAKEPDFRLGAVGETRKPEEQFTSSLGTFSYGARGLEGGERQIVPLVQQFDEQIASIVRSIGGGEEQLDRIREALSDWSIDLRGDAVTVENVLGARFREIMTAFDADVQQFVGSAGTLEERVSRLGSVLQLRALFDGAELEDSFGEWLSFAEEFQQQGEDISATFARITSAAAMLEDATAMMGISLDLGQLAFARFATEITDAAGGLDRAAGLWDAFFGRFYSNVERAELGVAQSRARAQTSFSDIGLDVADFQGSGGLAAFRALFEQRLPSLSAEAVVQWLEAAEAIGFVIDAEAALAQARGQSVPDTEALADAEAELIAQRTAGIVALEEMMAIIRRENAQLSEFAAGMLDAGNWRSTAIREANAHARAAGLAAASEADLADIELRASQMRAQAIRANEAALTALAADQGYIAAADTLDALNARIEQMQGGAYNAASAFEATGDAMTRATDTMRDQIALLLGDLSPFNDRTKLEIARSGLQAGNVSQEQFLQIAQRLFGNTSRYRQEFEYSQQFPSRAAADAGGSFRVAGSSQVSASGGDGRSLEQLIAARDELLRTQQAGRADEIARRIAEQSALTQESFASVAGRIGFGLDRVAADLGFTGEQLNDYLSEIAAQTRENNLALSTDTLVSAIETQTRAIVEAIRGPDAFAKPIFDDTNPGKPVPYEDDGGKALRVPLAPPVGRAEPDNVARVEFTAMKAEIAKVLGLLAEHLPVMRGASVGAAEATNEWLRFARELEAHMRALRNKANA